MVFDEFSEEFLAFQQSSFDSPDLRPIYMPMTHHGKDAHEGMINLSTAGTAFPNSNAFGQYLHSPYPAEQHLNVHNAVGHHQQQDNELEYYSRGQYYPANMAEQQHMLAVQQNNAQVEVSFQGTQQQQPKRKPSTDLKRIAIHKRKASAELEYIAPHPQERAAMTQLRVPDMNGEHHNRSGQSSPYYTPVMPVSNSNVVYLNTPGLESPRSRHQYSVSNASQISLAAPSPHTPVWSPGHTTTQTEHNSCGPMTPAPRPASTLASNHEEHPVLVRTSTISQQASPSMNPSACPGGYTQSFNPYTVYPQNKANLVLHGDLDGVALDWSAEELEARRKLVVFTRSQSGSTINANWEIVAQQDYKPSNGHPDSRTFVMSCIWWQEKKEAYCTSVDTINLLEELVAVRFTVEEKNRIRRNLEGFHPLTVSKAKAESEDFFKLIMGFPTPKPRNIEKDVKVFPWSILARALTKIIGKYSASPASTASQINTPAPSAYASTEHSGDYHFAPSPQQEIFSFRMPSGSMPVTYAESTMPTAMTSAPSPQYEMATFGMPVVSMPSATTTSAPFMSGGPVLPAHAPGMLVQYPMGPHTYSPGQMTMVSHDMTPHSAVAPIDRMQTGWAYSPLETQYMGPMNESTVGYFHGHFETAGTMESGHQVHQH